jgi:hypothetical protein
MLVLSAVQRFARHRRTRARPPGRAGARRLRPAARGRPSFGSGPSEPRAQCNRRVPSVRPVNALVRWLLTMVVVGFFVLAGG